MVPDYATKSVEPEQLKTADVFWPALIDRITTKRFFDNESE